jgi:hypothetical protein
VRNQIRGEVFFVGAQTPRRCRPQFPLRDTAVRNSQSPGGQRVADQSTHPLLVRWFSGENHPKGHDFTVTDIADVMRRKRARRLVVLPAAQCLRDRAAERIGAVAVTHGDHCIVGKGFARHGCVIHKK